MSRRHILPPAIRRRLRGMVLGLIKPELDAIHDGLAAQEQRTRRGFIGLRAGLLTQRRIPEKNGAGDERAPDPRPDAKSMEQCFQELQRMAPAAYALWKGALELNETAYHGEPMSNCSVDGHLVAELFRGFLRPYLTGTVLDIGCGPQPVPAYLAEYPHRLVAGLDPLAPPVPHPFVFHRGFTEFLPWGDASFRTVVAATSLDHVLLLDRSLQEIKRVLQKDGRLVVWVGFIKGFTKYDPHRPDIRKVDDFHLFHFDREWFEEVMSEFFVAEEILNVGEGDNSTFYSFRPRP